MTLFRIDVRRESGAIMLWMKTPCGFRQIIGWADLEGVKEFAEMLLDFYKSRRDEQDKVQEVSDELLRQALGTEEYFREQAE